MRYLFATRCPKYYDFCWLLYLTNSWLQRPPLVRAFSFLQFLRHLLKYDFGNLRTLQCCACLSSYNSLLCRFCSSVPDFVVSLPSVLASQLTTLRRTNDSGFQSAHKGLTPSGKITHCKICFLNRNLYFRIFIRPYSVGPAHAGHTHRIKLIANFSLFTKVLADFLSVIYLLTLVLKPRN